MESIESIETGPSESLSKRHGRDVQNAVESDRYLSSIVQGL